MDIGKRIFRLANTELLKHDLSLGLLDHQQILEMLCHCHKAVLGMRLNPKV
jgi:hypothetical protein